MRKHTTMLGFATLLLTAASCGTPAAEGGNETVTNDGTNETPSTEAPAPDEPVADEPLGAGPYPIANLEITITHPDTDPVSYTITCLGDTATVTGEVDVDDDSACLALGRSDIENRLVGGVPPDQICTQLYGGPDVATITGKIGDQAVDTAVNRADGCGVNDWDSVLSDILPMALGVDPGS